MFAKKNYLNRSQQSQIKQHFLESRNHLSSLPYYAKGSDTTKTPSLIMSRTLHWDNALKVKFGFRKKKKKQRILYIHVYNSVSKYVLFK